MASTKLQKTFSSAGNRKTFTFSVWIKRASVGSQAVILDSNYSGGANEHRLFIDSDDILEYYDYSGSAYQFRYKTNRKLRDTNGWYHIVCSVDTTQGTAGDRVKIYINGVRETSFSTSQNPSQNHDCILNNDQLHQIGTKNTGAAFFDGSMSHIHFVDGTAYQASTFGQTDSTTGEWSITTTPSVTYGTNGFFILKDGNSVTDQSPNSNNFTVASGTLTKTEDNPSNVFCTYNKLQQTNGAAGFENGSTYFTNGTQWLGVNGTIAATSGKYYAEFKVTGSTGWGVGVADVDSDANRTDYLSSANNGYQSKYTGGKQIFLNGSTIVAQENNSTVVNNAGMGNTSFAANDIVMVALDLDNNNLFFGKNGTWLRGATESEIEAGTSTNATFSGTSFNNKFWTWSVCTELENMRMNAGNGYFSTTAVSSAGTNASGIGIFEYDVPDGFTALSTKGLNE